MKSNSTSESNLLELSFEGECLKTLQEFVHPKKNETYLNETYLEDKSKEQVGIDLERIYCLTIKDQLGEQVYEIPSVSSEVDDKTRDSIIQTAKEKRKHDFFNKIEGLDKKLYQLFLENFHQGGMFYAARQFLTFHLNSLGFTPISNKHHIVCEFSPEKIVITENFSITTLESLSSDMLFKLIIQKGEYAPINLERSEREKVAYFQEHIIKSMGEKNSSDHQLKLKENSQKKVFQLAFNSEQETSLIEFTVKHTISLDPESKEVRIKELSKEDVSFKVQTQLYNLSSETSKPEFSKFLRPKPELNSFREFILLLFNLLYNLFFPPIPAETPLSSQNKSNEPENNFACGMRA